MAKAELDKPIEKDAATGLGLGVEYVGDNPHIQVLVDEKALADLFVTELHYPKKDLDHAHVRIDVTESLPRLAFSPFWNLDKSAEFIRNGDGELATFYFGRIYQYFDRHIQRFVNDYLSGWTSDRELYANFHRFLNAVEGGNRDLYRGVEDFCFEINSGSGSVESKLRYINKGWGWQTRYTALNLYGEDRFIKGISRFDRELDNYGSDQREGLADRVYARIHRDALPILRLNVAD